MSEDEINKEPTTEEPKRKRIIRRRRRLLTKKTSVPAVPKVAKDDDEFFGMGVGGWPCADRCKDGLCYITGERVCGSPLQCGLQPHHKHVREIVSRFNRAKAYVEKMKIDAKDKK